MNKKITFEKKIEFPTMIGEVCAISLEQNLKFINESSVKGDLLLNGKYKFSEASRLEEDFNYKIPIEIALVEKLDLNTTSIEITDFHYEIENDYTMICYIELEITGAEISLAKEDRECDGDEAKKIEIPILNEEEVVEESVEKVNSTTDINSLFSNLDDREDEYGTFIVYIVRNNETINSIIEKYNVTLEDIEKYNDLKDISIGTKLIIPVNND